MTKRLCLTLLLIPLAQNAWAQLPAAQPRTDNEIIKAEQIALSNTDRNALQKRLEQAVVTVYAEQPKSHHLAETGARFDGAAVAILPEAVADILPKDAIQEITEPTPPKKRSNGSFFNRGLDRASSPFAKKSAPKKHLQSTRQYYLTTADWLTNSTIFEIDIYGERITAKLEYRDDAQNLAVLSTSASEKLSPVELCNPDDTLPSLAFALLSPNTIYESFTQHALHVPEMHLYGTTTLTARNGYPLFSVQGKLLGLLVGPDKANTKGLVVHPGLIDRALHPEKYSRVKIEEIKLETY